MDDALAVGAVEGVGDLPGVFESLGERKRALLQAAEEAFAFQVLHHHVIDVTFAANVVEDADVRVLERRDGAGFAFEALEDVLAPGDVRGENFEGDRAVQARVAGLVDFAHATRAERGEDFVRSEPRARVRGISPRIIPLLGNSSV